MCSTAQGELYGDRTAGFHGYSHLTGGFDGGQAEYARVPFGEDRSPYLNCRRSMHILIIDTQRSFKLSGFAVGLRFWQHILHK